MFAFVPSMGTLFQRFVIALLVLFDQPFDADVPADFIAEMIALVQKHKAGNPAVAVAERVNAEKVEVEGCDCDQGMYPALTYGLPP